jgi:hypothetical protein
MTSYTATDGYLRLIAPNSPDISPFSLPEVSARCAEWAADGDLYRVEGVAACPHGLYGMDWCPEDACDRGRTLDHGSVWFSPPPELGERPKLFVLAHLYNPEDVVMATLRPMADAHGLRLASWRRDRWYSDGTTPVRLSAVPDFGMWPLLSRALDLLPMLGPVVIP